MSGLPRLDVRRFDERNFVIVKRVRSAKDGVERENILGYYSTLESCLKAAMDDGLRGNTVKELSTQLDKALKRVEEIAARLTKEGIPLHRAKEDKDGTES